MDLLNSYLVMGTDCTVKSTVDIDKLLDDRGLVSSEISLDASLYCRHSIYLL